MRNDLLSAQASVDWAVSNFPALQKRLDIWRDDNLHVVIEDLPSDNPNSIIVAREKEPLPLMFNAEVGAYINAIRSSLDILATSLVERYRIPIKEEDTYFPVLNSEAQFRSPRYKGSEFVQGLPPTERGIIETLKPYKGGNNLLWSLHHLDIVRKHCRLLTVEPNPVSFHINGWGLESTFTPISGGWMCNPGETVLGFLAKGAPKPKMEFTGYIGLNEPGALARHPLVPALDKFASLANSIITLFDTP